MPMVSGMPVTAAAAASGLAHNTAAAVAALIEASLYVGDLHPLVSEQHVLDAFREFKSLDSVRVCRDSLSGQSLCYGYVNFRSKQDAIRAIETMNHSVLYGKAMRVMWSVRDPDARKNGIANVFVKNISESINSVKLQELFAKFGQILSCKVAEAENGKSKGYGFVQFRDEKSATDAIENMNGIVVDGKELYVGKFMRKIDRILSSSDVNYTNLYMKNLELDLSEDALVEKFSKFGKIVSLAIAKDENGVSKGFGFVNFESHADARNAMEAMNGVTLGSKSLFVARAQKKVERKHILHRQFEEKRLEQAMKYMGSNVYIKNINDDVTEDELRDLFSQCGNITSTKLMRDNKGINKGFGFVCFSNSEEACRAVTVFHGHMFHRKPLYVAIAQRKEERRAQLQLQRTQMFGGFGGASAAMVPNGHQPFYYPAAPRMMSQIPQQQPVMYQPMMGGMMPAWRGNGFGLVNNRPVFQPSPVSMVPYGAATQKRQTRGRMYGNGPILGAGQFQPVYYPKEPYNPPFQRGAGRVNHAPNGRRQLNKSSSNISSASSGTAGNGSEDLSSMLAAATPQQQKQILGERLYPLVENHKFDLASKITGMLLEMDNTELLLLLESPDSLASKVNEAVQVLEFSKNKITGQDGGGFSSVLLSAASDVAVN